MTAWRQGAYGGRMDSLSGGSEEMLRRYFEYLRTDYAAQRKAEWARNERMYRECHIQAGPAQKFRREDAIEAPSASVPRFRVVAEPCAQGFRLKRYEQVAGLAEMVLVSVEIVRT